MTAELLEALREVDAMLPDTPPVAPRCLIGLGGPDVPAAAPWGYPPWSFLVAAAIGYPLAIYFASDWILGMTTVITAGMAGNMAARPTPGS